MKPATFEYCRPDTVEEAIALLAEFGGDASVLAGGMSLGPMLNMRLARPGAVIDIKRVSGLDAVKRDGLETITGATLTQARALADSRVREAVPLLALALPWVGHYQTRNRGTLAGSVAHADPSAETPLVLATLGGAVEVASARGTRRIPARAWFVDIMTTARESDELVTALVWPARTPGAGQGFREIAQRHGDFAIVACAAEAVVAGGRLKHLAFGVGGATNVPHVPDTAAYVGEAATPALAARIAGSVADAIDATSDHKASAAYRRNLVRVLGAEAIADAFASAEGVVR
jgi:2-furoyl-CoA dehydrogenase FAD binding subunit